MCAHSSIQQCVLCFQGPVFLRVQGYPCNRQESRALSFSEEKAHWQIPMNEVNIICDVTTKDGIHSHRNIIRTVTGYILRSQLLWSFTGILEDTVDEVYNKERERDGKQYVIYDIYYNKE